MRNIHIIAALGVASSTLGCGSDEAPPGGNPGSASDRIYVADEESGTISIIDEATQKRVANIALPMGAAMYMPHNVQVAPDGNSVWVVAPPMTEGAAPDKAFVLDPRTDQVVGDIELGTDLHVAHVVLDPTSSRAYVTANEASSVIEIDAQERTVLRSIDLGPDKGPHGARFCRDKLYTANMTGRSLGIVDPATGNVQDVAVGGVAVQTACTPDGRFVFASLYDTKELVRYEIDSGALARIALPSESQGPVQLYPSPDSNELWVCDQGLLEGRPASNKLYRIDVEAASVTGTVEVGQGAHGVVVSDDGALAYVTNIAEASVSMVDTAALSVVATVAVGTKPNGVSHWHGSGGMP